jgi:3-dehydroquinate synthase
MRYAVNFPGGTVQYVFGSFSESLPGLIPGQAVLIADQNVTGLYPSLLKEYTIAQVPPREEQKSLAVVGTLTEQLLTQQVHRKTFLVGVGGGVITDLTGFLASIYMRGVSFGFVPTTLLAMVDAAIGGKNGVNIGGHKNFVGTISQPKFILFDTQFLKTLPDAEWSNGFAEVIKYACLFDKTLFEELELRDINYYRQNEMALSKLIKRCVELKNIVVVGDERDTGLRKLLNFGHTAGHAFETLHQLPHGHAVALGMLIACRVSEDEAGLDKTVIQRLKKLLQQYELPVQLAYDTDSVVNILKMDKKRNEQAVDYIVLREVGKAAIKTISFEVIQKALESYE